MDSEFCLKRKRKLDLTKMVVFISFPSKPLICDMVTNFFRPTQFLRVFASSVGEFLLLLLEEIVKLFKFLQNTITLQVPSRIKTHKMTSFNN